MPQTRRRTGLAVLLTCAAAGVLVPAGAGAASLDLESMTLAQLHAALLAKRTTCTAIVTAELGRITAYDHRGPALDAIISVNPEALADAAVLDARQARGDALAPAHCTPIVVKDNITEVLVDSGYWTEAEITG